MAPGILLRIMLGLVLSTLVGLLALRRGSLAPTGVLGAVLTGTLVVGFGGFGAGFLLVAFFASSSALSHYQRGHAGKQNAATAFDKTSRRDLGQALANGGVAVVLAIAYGLTQSESSARPLMVYAGLVGALCAANADTWATEIGVLATTQPRLITDLRRRVPAGTSGGITGPGTLAALFGGLFIALAFALVTLVDGMLIPLALTSAWLNSLFFGPLHVDWFGLAGLGIVVFVIAGTIGGLAGALFDSVMGATVQGIYYSRARNRETERHSDPDGTPNLQIRGAAWLNNDWVNFLSSAAGAAVAMLLFSVLNTLFSALFL